MTPLGKDGKVDDKGWNEKEFDKIFDLFEEDDPHKSMVEGKAVGLDRDEFAKLVKRIA